MACWAPPQVRWLDSARLHLHHGPIDLIIGCDGQDSERAFRQAVARFDTVLEELVEELPLLRQPLAEDTFFKGTIARRMAAAITPHSNVFVTPMAGVAGAVADEVLAAMVTGCDLTKAYVNNGGDIAFHITRGEHVTAAVAGVPGGQIVLTDADPFRGIATSGWRGRSHSLGIADSVSVVAQSAADADVAATLIANAVTLDTHPAISRTPARELSPDSDLGERLVTTDVGPLSYDAITEALNAGARVADDFFARGLIGGAFLTLQNEMRTVGPLSIDKEDPEDKDHGRIQAA